MRFRQGLVVGKFSPLHRGHEALIAYAAARCERLLVLAYSQPALPGCGTAARQRWLDRRVVAVHPNVQALSLDDTVMQQRSAAAGLPWQPMPDNCAADQIHQSYLAWMLRVLDCLPDAMFTSEAYGPNCAATLTARLSRQGHRVEHIAFDPPRQACPVSASQVRRDPVVQRTWLAPEVWADLLPRIVVLGGESSGKTTLAAHLAAALGTRWVPEYGREHWTLRRGLLTEADLLFIAEEQIRREDAAALAVAGEGGAVLVCDTSPLTTLGYQGWMFGRPAAALQALAGRPYAFTVLCHPDFEFVQDGTRRDDRFRRQQHAWYEAQLGTRGVVPLHACGTLADRVKHVVARVRESCHGV